MNANDSILMADRALPENHEDNISMVDHAQALAARGYWVFRLAAGKKTPARKGWQDEATRDPKKITDLFSNGRFNIGIFCGKFGDDKALCVIDVDDKAGKQGSVELAKLQSAGKTCPPTYTQHTPTGGRHLVYSVDRPVKQGCDVLAPGLDIRSHGGYIVAAGSELENGQYSANDAPPAPAPSWLIDACGAPRIRDDDAGKVPAGATINAPSQIRRIIEYLSAVAPAIEGEAGDQTTFKTACTVKDMGVDADTAFELMAEHWNPRCVPVWDADTLHEKIANAYRYGNAAIGAAAPENEFPPVVRDGLLDSMPDYKRRGNGGAISATISNVVAALRRPDQCGARLAWDEFRAEVVVSPAGADDWRPLADSHYTRFRMQLESRGFDPVSKDLVRDAIWEVAESNRFDSAVFWLDGLKWDGVPRVDRFFSDYYGAPNTRYSTAVSRYWWTGLSGRVLSAPCQCDMAVAITGAQGIGKTQGVRAMVPSPDQFVEIDLGVRDDDLARAMRGGLVGEIGELRGLYSRDAEALKSWISRIIERWVPKYKEFTATYSRRLMLIATTNAEQFLADETGERRWLPLRSKGVNINAIRRDRDQLWAEGAVLFRKNGVMWKEAAELAADQHADYKIVDVWTDAITKWLDGRPETIDDSGNTVRERWRRGDRPFRLPDMLEGALLVSTASQTKAIQARASSILRTLGYDSERCTMDGRQVRAWQKKTTQ